MLLPPIHRLVLAGLTWPALLGVIAGTALQLQQANLVSGWLYAGLVLLALVGWAWLATISIAVVKRTGLLLLAFAVLGFSATGLRSVGFVQQALNPALEGRDLQVTGVVASLPQVTENGHRFRFDVNSASLDGALVRLPPRIDLGWYTGQFGVPRDAAALALPSPVVPGEVWRLTVRLKAPHGARNPHGFDYELWLWEQGVQATGYIRTGANDPAPQRLLQTVFYPVERLRHWVRTLIFARIPDRSHAGLVAALVVGDQNAIEHRDWDMFRATGVSHLMAISGLHITMFAWVAMGLIAALWRRSGALCLWLPAPKAALLGGLMLATVYAVFSGWGVPAQRTILMLWVVSASTLLGIRWPWPQVWLLACAAVLLIDPWALLQAGFWLSFVAVGVLFASNSGASSASGTRAFGRIAHMFREQWVITLALTPLTLLLFGQVSVVGLASNALAIPWVTLVITPLAMAGVFVPPLWGLASMAIEGMNWYLAQLAALPFATVSVAQAPLWAGASGVLGGVLLVMSLPWRFRLIGLPLVLPVLLWQAPRPPIGEFELWAADVGQGNAVIVQTARHVLVYDTGPRYGLDNDAGQRVLVPMLSAFGARVDALVLSHRDSDHVGGAAAVLLAHPKATMLSSIEDTHELQRLRPATRCQAGQQWRWDGVDFEVLHPSASDYEGASKSNALSCTLRISNGQRAALLAGDIEKAQELRLTAQGVNLKADILLVPHHGSQTSSTPEFLDAVSPRIALVQSGYRNRYGHPARPVVVRYENRGIQLVDSSRCGAAQWRSERPDRVVCQRDIQARYWQHMAY
ncbi:DNA internalization-related competence protein ComEC/Rec2 [Rhodoferax sp. PAMC 29310]|uniref:DNA internalization-related competence protein ComEC/Rec2 n=1 Tax=Rhodoferax sp. PAMC 29310 TaxID=2822760 RepID=UPI001B335F15|nr:DNA internalization-related competence protein ComEC/Rec2 [Rhodoferax sp. PAMC 29310]